MRKIERQGVEIIVEDEDATAYWKFWNRYCKAWGAPIMAVMDEFLSEGARAEFIAPGTFLDIGAWVGPMTLWAALKHDCYVIAVEPDPVAFEQLERNVEANGLQDQVECLQVAASYTDDGEVGLYPGDKFGRSHSSMTACCGEKPVYVKAMNAAFLVSWNQPDLVKMDIEGGEAIVIPAIGPVMRQLGIPLLLSLHPGHYGQADVEPMNEELSRWNKKPVGTTQTDGEEWLYTPR